MTYCYILTLLLFLMGVFIFCRVFASTDTTKRNRQSGYTSRQVLQQGFVLVSLNRHSTCPVCSALSNDRAGRHVHRGVEIMHEFWTLSVSVDVAVHI